MKWIAIALLGFVVGCTVTPTQIARTSTSSTRLRTEYLSNPVGLTETHPRFSWELVDSRRGAKQTAYQLAVASSPELLTSAPDLWDTGRITSDATSQIAYQGKPLGSRQTCYWRVRWWDAQGVTSPWSETAMFEVGLLAPSEWKAAWIADPVNHHSTSSLKLIRASYETPDGKVSKDVLSQLTRRVKNNVLYLRVTNNNLGGDPAKDLVKQLRVTYEVDGQRMEKIYAENETIDLPKAIVPSVPLFRKTFDLNKPVAKARLYVTARGLYDMRLNAQAVSNHVLAPEWTDYRKRQSYQTFDVTSKLKQGPNALAAQLAHGWFSGTIGNGGFRYYGITPSLLAQLEITFADGTKQTLCTDSSWRSGVGPITSTDFMMGENYDAQAEVQGWDTPGLNDASWPAVAVVDPPAANVIFTGLVSEPVRELMTLPAKSMRRLDNGAWVFDLGQNMVGVVKLKVWAPAGRKITLRHAEFLNPDGTLYTTNLRGAPSIDTYICKGSTVPKVWQPRFTFHGFRYVEVSGLSENPELEDVTGVVIGSDVAYRNHFESSDPRLNQLQSNIVWGQRGNFVSVPTDCPQRNERLGWTGDAQVFVGTAAYNADVSAFFTRWLVDMDDAQTPDGRFTDVVPDTMGGAGAPGWGDAGVICPWVIYRTYGDTRVLKTHLPAMIKWVEWCKAHSNNLIREKDRGNDFGDWLAIGSDTPKELLGTAYFAYSTKLTAQAARIVGDTATADKYDRLFQDIKAAFNARYVLPDGTLKAGTQTAYAMALHFDLLPENLRARAGDKLAGNIQGKDWRLSTGFLGVSYLLPVLSATDNLPTAYRLLLQDGFPSWLFSVKHGATTIWERWDGWTPDKGFQDPGMNSFNHYALGSCGQWMFEHLAGIRQPADSAGFKHILIAPEIMPPLTRASATYHSIHGQIKSAWKVENGQLQLDVTVPPNTVATIKLPTKNPSSVTETTLDVKSATRSTSTNQITLEVPAGTYTFKAAAPY